MLHHDSVISLCATSKLTEYGVTTYVTPNGVTICDAHMLYWNYSTTELKQLKITDYMHTYINIATTCYQSSVPGQYKTNVGTYAAFC